MDRDIQSLREHGVQASAQRLAVARYVLHTSDHPCADEVFSHVRRGFPTLSRATVYNTLNLFVDRGLLRQHSLKEGRVVFDPNLARHHHFIDAETGEIHDLPWDALDVSGVDRVEEFEVEEFQVVLRGRRRENRHRGSSRAAVSEGERP